MTRGHHTPTLPPRGLCREDAARYLGIGTTLFDKLVASGRMPEPIRIDGRNVWDRHAIDEKFDALGNNAKDVNPWDQLED